MTKAVLGVEIERLQPPQARDVAKKHPDVVAVQKVVDALTEKEQEARHAAGRARQEMEYWRIEHPMRARVHDAGLLRAGYLAQREQILQEGLGEMKRLDPLIKKATQHTEAVQERILVQVWKEQEPLLVRIEELKLIYQQKAAQEQEQARKARAVEEALKAFKAQAAKREMKAHGYQEASKKWNALPEGTRKGIEDFNRLPQQERAGVLDEMRQGLEREPERVKSLAEQLDLDRGKGRGLARSR
jgi:hypothetical protein